MTNAQVKKMLYDIAVTVSLHLVSVSIEAAANGRLYVGKDVKMFVYVAKNIYEVAKARAEKPRKQKEEASIKACKNVRLMNDQIIPTHIYKFKITVGSVRSVVVVEYRDVATAMSGIDGNLPEVKGLEMLSSISD